MSNISTSDLTRVIRSITLRRFNGTTLRRNSLLQSTVRRQTSRRSRQQTKAGLHVHLLQDRRTTSTNGHGAITVFTMRLLSTFITNLVT